MAQFMATNVTRRSVLGNMSAAFGMSLVPMTALSSAPTSSSLAPVFCVSKRIARSEIEALLAAMRKAHGCLTVKVLAEPDGYLTVLQEWQSSEAQFQFWQSGRSVPPQTTFKKLVF